MFKDGAGGNGKDAADLADKAIQDAKGRRDKGQEGVPDEKKLKEALPGVAKILKEKQEADERYSKKVKAVAKAAGFMSSVVRAAAKEMLAEPEDREAAARHAEQLTLAFGVVEKLKK